MAKFNEAAFIDEEPYLRRDPVTGQEKLFFRKRHDTIHSPRLQAYDRCMADQLRGHRYRGHGAAADEAAVREALRQAAQYCHAHGTVTSKGGE